MAALQLTCAYELFQVWNMATTETQLMLSVGLIGKFRLGSRSFVFFFLSEVGVSDPLNMQDNHMILL